MCFKLCANVILHHISFLIKYRQLSLLQRALHLSPIELANAALLCGATNFSDFQF